MKRIIWLNYTSIGDQCAQNNENVAKETIDAIDMHNQVPQDTQWHTSSESNLYSCVLYR